MSNSEDFEIKSNLYASFDEESRSFGSSENEIVNVEDDDIHMFCLNFFN